MTEALTQGDRVIVSSGERGTVLSIDGVHVYVRLDSGRHMMSAMVGSLKKIANDVN